MPKLEELQPHTVFQQSETLSYCDLIVRSHLDTAFTNKRIGRADPIPWPHFFPDVTPMDF